MPLQYPIIFPYEDRWHCYQKFKENGKKKGMRPRVSMRFFFCIQNLTKRGGRYDHSQTGKIISAICCCLVDAYASIEEYGLRWVRNNQQNLRCELYQGLQDAVTAGENDTSLVGKKIILPSSFIGDPTYMVQNYQKTMQYLCGLDRLTISLPSLAIQIGQKFMISLK